MCKNHNIIKILAVVIFLSATACSANQPSYQVSLYVHLHPRGPPVHLCNGIVVQSRLILTTASCVHYKFSSTNSPVVSIEPHMISVISGSSTEYNDELTLQVDAIFVADKFNFTTGENDLALLRLNGVLPLDTRNDISWITLTADDDFDGSCLANFYVRNSLDGAPNYIQSEHLELLDSEVCGAIYEYPYEREDDICSLYYLPAGFNCNAVESLQNYNGDRGTGLICGNKLMGILSTILPAQNKNDCIEEPIKAYYTALAPHLNWIYEFIALEEIQLFNEGNNVYSLPYGGETNAFIKPEQTDPVTTIGYNDTDTNLTTSTEASTLYTAGANSKGKFKFVCYIFLIYLPLLAFIC